MTIGLIYGLTASENLAAMGFGCPRLSSVVLAVGAKKREG